MLSVHYLRKSYGIQAVLEDIHFNINAGEKIGLVGPNGSGKTTLLRILAGHERADSGTVSQTLPGLRIGYLSQGLDLPLDSTVHATLNPGTVDEAALAAEIASMAQALADSPADSTLQERYNAVLEQLSTPSVHPERVLARFGLANLDPQTPVAQLSGGQKTRLMLARILLAEPHLLLLDEPSNHLDIAMLEWLEGWIRRFKGAALIVSHDRAFLDNTVTSIFEMNTQTHQLKAYTGNYSNYTAQKAYEFEQQQEAYVDQQQQVAQLRSAANRLRGMTKMKKGGKADSGDKFAKEFFGNRATKGLAARAKSIEARINHILEEEKIDKPRTDWQVKLDFASGHQSHEIFSAQNLSVGYTPGNPLLTNLDLYINKGQKIVLTGENGSGKTTLLRTIANKLPPLGGTLKLGAAVKLGYMTQEQENLPLGQTPLQSLQAVAPFSETEARHFLHFMLFSGDDALRPTHSLSFGERTRLQLGLLIAQDCNFLLLDEPVNHLDITSRSRLEQALSQFQGAVLAVVHDRYFIKHFAEKVWLVEDNLLKVL
ncbi:MAG TPA: ABC-F family ATP-binding cassette domain-containing protein [Anaerolineales bacterium]|mgnify:CR=1 FL=1|nr:ABC-F family ATP-binding cassette domain-containing protein [Anaerolineales bacterium]HRQ92908.1 ABC-F family ATP-binding cassette domain-containing protein [Anaerolineales bacterium]